MHTPRVDQLYDHPTHHEQRISEQTRSDTLATIARWLAAAGVFVFFLFWSAFLALLIGFSVEPPSPARITDSRPALVYSVVAGLLGVVGARVILQRRVPSWWMLLALPIPALIAVDQAGWLG